MMEGLDTTDDTGGGATTANREFNFQVLCPLSTYIRKKEKKRREEGQRLTFDYLPSLSNLFNFFYSTFPTFQKITTP
jgi:hypothetical protein